MARGNDLLPKRNGALARRVALDLHPTAESLHGAAAQPVVRRDRANSSGRRAAIGGRGGRGAAVHAARRVSGLLQSMPAQNQIKCTLTFTNSTVTGNKNTDSKHIHENAMDGHLWT